MDAKDNQKAARKPYSAPKLRKFELTDDEAARLRASGDPMAELLKMKPDPLAGD